MSDDLHTRLHTAITTRLEAARAATPGPWEYDREGRIASADGVHHEWVTGGSVWPLRLADENGVHIATNDPACVVRACERDLRVLQRHPRVERDENCDEYDAPGPFFKCAHCSVQPLDSAWEITRDWPCSEITDLATVYLETP